MDSPIHDLNFKNQNGFIQISEIVFFQNSSTEKFTKSVLVMTHEIVDDIFPMTQGLNVHHEESRIQQEIESIFAPSTPRSRVIAERTK